MSSTPSAPPLDLAQLVSCVSGYDPKALPVDKVQEVIRRFVQPVRVAERVDLRAALGRVLAEDVIAPMDVPAHNNSGMDGYALRSGDLGVDGAASLRVAGIGLAGHEFSGEVPAGSCLRIMTGAVLPASCDTVVPQEFCSVEGEQIHILAGVLKPGDNARMRGEDLRAGQPALLAGKLLRPADIGLIASLGQAEVIVWRRLRVAFLSSGDELRSIGQPLDEGCVYDSNRYTLWAMLQRLGCDVLDLGVVRDDPALLKATLRHACENADAVITSGGVSVGEADHLRSAMAALGDVAFWHIAMRPGRPMAFGSIASHGQSAVLFGLPGNPVAVMVTFYAFVRDALLQMMGASTKPLPLLAVAAQTALRKRPGRTEYQRAVLSTLPDQSGRYSARTTGDQGSGILRSMSEADGFIVLHHEQSSVHAGEVVDFLPLEGLV
jgi:molybdopterin molybdotransferase